MDIDYDIDYVAGYRLFQKIWRVLFFKLRKQINVSFPPTHFVPYNIHIIL